MKKLFGKRVFKLCIVILLQIIAVFTLITFASHKTVIYNGVIIINLLIGVSLLSKDDLNPVYKIMWILILAGLPILGTVIYLLWGDRKVPKRKAEEMADALEKAKNALKQYGKNIPCDTLSGGEKASAKYLEKFACAPVYSNTEAMYLKNGETFFEELKRELNNAKKFIFMEYFIIKDGKMWDEIREILINKAKDGVKVKIIYDAIGSIFDLSDDFSKDMRKYGIECHRFNPIKFSWIISDYTFLNHRDHRKICVIDGDVGFTGGINIADEYINEISPCGYWKDTAVKLTGDGVFSLTVSFLKMWDGLIPKKDMDDYINYAPQKSCNTDFHVQPYEDSPIDVENVSENSYFNVIYHARKYVYITTPYLIIDNEMLVSLSLAAKSGVDVKIIVPGIPDKWYAYYLTQSYYGELLRAGVKIYEYTPGFIHAKMFVRDGEQAIVGSANMDYRSLYLHFEYCCQFYGGHIVEDVKKDIDDILLNCREVTMEDVKNVSKFKRMLQVILKFFAPLM